MSDFEFDAITGRPFESDVQDSLERVHAKLRETHQQAEDIIKSTTGRRMSDHE